MKYIDEALIYCDGDCKPNPGIMVGAFLITDAENILKGPVGNNFGDGTNIVAELKAIKYALDEAVSCTSRNFCPPVLGDGCAVAEGNPTSQNSVLGFCLK